jgi:hypothetical protein
MRNTAPTRGDWVEAAGGGRFPGQLVAPHAVNRLAGADGGDSRWRERRLPGIGWARAVSVRFGAPENYCGAKN